jgi:hypothetical protein
MRIGQGDSAMDRHLALVISFVALACWGCASTPNPRDDIAKARLAVEQAEQERAEEFAPVEMRMAREKLERAEKEIEDEDYTDAVEQAEQAEVDAALALAKARNARQQAAADEMERTLRALAEEARR